MPVSTDEILKAAEILSESRSLTVSITESAKGALTVGACAFVGSLFGGPVGLGVGGTIGALMTAYRGQGKYKSVLHIIQHEMTAAQKTRLAISIKKSLENVGIEEVAMVASYLISEGAIQQLIIRELFHFISKEMGYSAVSQ